MDALNLPDNFTYLPILNENEDFIFRIKEVTDECSANAWLELYSEQTKSTWRKAQTFPKSGRVNVFKVILRCMHNTDRRVRGVRSSKHTGCKVKMTISVKRYIERSHVQSNDLLTKEYPTIVSLKGKHNHPTSTCDVLKHRDLSPKIKLKFLKFFREGHSPASALRSHKTDLQREYGADYHKIAADGKFLPSYSIVHKLFQNELKKECKSFFGERGVFESLKEFLSNYEKNIGAVVKLMPIDNEHYFIILCTPMMLRAHEKLFQTSELVMVDASRNVNQEGHQIYFFTTPSAAGCIPIGIIITNSENENVFIRAVQCFKECLPKTTFFSKQYPRIVMIGNDLTEFSGLKENFPSSRLLLCHFYVLKTVWKWLSDTSHNIELENRQELFFTFRKLLYSQNEDTVEQNLNELVKLAIRLNFTDFILYITKFMEVKEMWITFYREDLPTNGNNANDYSELVFHLGKYYMLKKVKSFNIIQLVDFFLYQYEMYYKKRLFEFWNGKYTNTVLKKMMQHHTSENFVIQAKGISVFSVIDEKNELFYVNLEQEMCSCSDNSRELCRHLSAVILKLDNNIMTANDIALTRHKEILFYIAMGVLPQNDGYSSLQESSLKILEQSKEMSEEEEMSEIDTNTTYLPNNNGIIVVQHVKPLSSKEVEKLESFFSRIMDGLEEDPINYIPTVRTLLNNIDALSNIEFLTCLHNFGKHNDHKASNVKVPKNVSKGRHKPNIRLQPTVRK